MLKGKAVIKKFGLIADGSGCFSLHLLNDENCKNCVWSKNLVTEQYLEDEEGRRQGLSRNFTYCLVKENKDGYLPHWEEVGVYEGRAIVRCIASTQEYSDDQKNGLYLRFDVDSGKVCKVTPFVMGVIDGLEVKYSDGKPEYKLYRNNDVIFNDKTLRQMWTEVVEGLKYEKDMDNKDRSETLTKVLEAGTKEKKKNILKEFHSKQSPVGVKRRTAVKFDR